MISRCMNCWITLYNCVGQGDLFICPSSRKSKNLVLLCMLLVSLIALHFTFILLASCRHCSANNLSDESDFGIMQNIRWRSVTNFSGQSRILRACPEKIRGHSGCWIVPNSKFVPITSRYVAVQAVDQNAVDHFDVFACQEMCSVELKTHQIHFRLGICLGPRCGSLERSPRPLNRMGRGYPPYIPPQRLRWLDLGVFATSKSVQNFYHRFMVTLQNNT